VLALVLAGGAAVLSRWRWRWRWLALAGAGAGAGWWCGGPITLALALAGAGAGAGWCWLALQSYHLQPNKKQTIKNRSHLAMRTAVVFEMSQKMSVRIANSSK